MEEMTRVFRLFLAPTTLEKRIRKRTGAALAETLYNHTDDRVRRFPNPARYEPRIKGEQPFPVIVKAPVPLLGPSDTPPQGPPYGWQLDGQTLPQFQTEVDKVLQCYARYAALKGKSG